MIDLFALLPYRVLLVLYGVQMRLAPKLLWHRAFGHPAAQRVGPWCNCMGVFVPDCADDKAPDP